MSNMLKPLDWNDERIQLLRDTYAKALNPKQFEVFLQVARDAGLNPFTRQIYAIPRGGQLTIQTGIDGYRAIAARTGLYAGKDEAEFTYAEKSKLPDRCKVTVYKIVQGIRAAFTATARWNEYFPGDKLGAMWKRMPETMLEKCAEAKALRMAFPEALAGIHVAEEMQLERDVSQRAKELSERFSQVEPPDAPEFPTEIELDLSDEGQE